MTWQAASFVILGLVLAGGFAWYERSRPPSQTVALVAAMAALAVAGRLVLAPVPNVVATTDIVLITGYAIGAGPGFATGALAAVVSNFWLGQGPWTPWQMAGWGLCGVLGALLAGPTRGRIGRLRLAAACGLAGLAFGALMNFSLMVSYGGEFSLARFEALWLRAVPFDLAHAIGNVTLALVAGPALLRMLVRFRERFQVVWRAADGPLGVDGKPAGAGAAGAMVAVLLGLVVLCVPAEDARAGSGAGAAIEWLRAQQNADGGFAASPGGSSGVAMTGWAALGLEAAGRNPLDVRRGGANPISFLRDNADRIRGTGDIERTILVLAGAGVSPRSFAGRDLVDQLRRRQSSSGSYSGQVNLTAFAVMAMRGAGSSVGVNAARGWLRQAQNGDGGWGFQPQASSDADSTGATLQALRRGEVARRGVAYLRRAQRSGGGYSLSNGPVNSQSTAWAVQGLVAAGVSPASVRTGGKSPLDYLAARQAADGHYRYSASSDQTPVWVTDQALVAAKQRAFPLGAVGRRRAAGASSSASGAKGGGAHRRRSAGKGKKRGHHKRARHGGGAADARSPAGEERARLRGTASAPATDAGTPSAEGSVPKERLIGGGAGAAAVLGGGFLLWYRRRYGSLPWS